MLILLCSLAACGKTDHDSHDAGAHDHANGEEHDHSGDNEHVDRSQHLVHFSDQSELFLQYETLVAQRDSIFLAHLTDLSDYTPIPGGFITVTLSGDGAPEETFSGKRPVRAGIHIEVVIPQYAGKRQLTLQLHTPERTLTHELGSVTVYSNNAESKNIAPRHRPENSTYLDKEAQWQAEIMIQTPTLNEQQQLMLPASAIYQSNSKHYLFVMKGAEFFEKREVTTGNHHHSQVIIIDGITAGEHVVIRGGHVLLGNQESTATEVVTTDDTKHHH